ncbi:MAG: hypothetical protein A2583_03165 [Bdellovibrionales bacterium RIFOXYD1_FULL_53_11]|nr:MAG: hypothetical protein A2583_03165 [Bdellovibrionales bacterium RIFOXYD1_FULL_53_11]
MKNKQLLYIYGRKEMVVLVLLGILIAMFAFTLGLHLGKKIESKRAAAQIDAVPLSTSPDKLPNRAEINEQGKGTLSAVDDSLGQTLHEEVVRMGAKLDKPIPTELPDKPRAASGGATTKIPPSPKPAAAAHEEKAKDISEESVPAALRPAPTGKFTVQAGSYKTLEEARDQSNILEASGEKPFIRATEVRGKGKWFRVYSGGFKTREEAERAGANFKSKELLQSFVVVGRVE